MLYDDRVEKTEENGKTNRSTVCRKSSILKLYERGTGEVGLGNKENGPLSTSERKPINCRSE